MKDRKEQFKESVAENLRTDQEIARNVFGNDTPEAMVPVELNQARHWLRNISITLEEWYREWQEMMRKG